MAFGRLLSSRLWWLWLLLLFVGVIYLASLVHYRIDLTQEKRFSLTNSTKRVLKSIQEPIQIDIFLSGDLSAGFKRLTVASDELLSEFKEYSHNNLSVHFINPDDLIPAALRNPKDDRTKFLSDSIRYTIYDSLKSLGIKPVRNELSTGDKQADRIIFPGANIQFGEKHMPVDLMSGKSGMDEESSLNYSEALLEFKFADAIDKLTRKEHPVVAYVAGNGEPLNPTVRDLFDALSMNYRFGVIDLKKGYPDADTISAMVIVKPSKQFTETDKLKIDQYIMHGGKVIWFIDKLYAEYDSLRRSNADFVAFDKGLDLDDLLFRYGVRINGNLLQDLNCARLPTVTGMVGNQPQIQRLPFPYYPLLSSPSDHPISRNLDNVLSIFPGTIDTVKASGITKTILLASDTNSRTLSTPAIVYLQSIKNDEDFRLFNKSYLPVAVLLQGKFTSLFANRFTQQLQDTFNAYTNTAFLPAAAKETQQIVVSDGDIVTNEVTSTDGPLTMGMLPYDNYQFANREFFLNAVDFLVNPTGVLEARNKNITLRLLDRQKVAVEKVKWQFINIGLPILIILLFGWLYQQRRKKRYAV